MARLHKLEPEFVELMPQGLLPGTLYISISYATTQHLCACGCGNKVVLPLSPADWTMCFDGEAVSMDPSVGNWEYPCKSHYWIEKNQVRWAGRWTPAQIEAGRARDLEDVESYFARRAAANGTRTDAKPAWWSGVFRAVSRRIRR